MQPQPIPPSSRFDSPERARIIGFWMAGAVMLMVIGVFSPHLLTIHHETMGSWSEINIGLFAAERCTSLGCEPTSVHQFFADTRWEPAAEIAILAFRAAAILAIATSAAISIMFFTGMRVRRPQAAIPAGIFLCFLSYLVLALELGITQRITGINLMEIATIPSMHDTSITPGIVILPLIVGTYIALHHTATLPTPRFDVGPAASPGTEEDPHTAAHP